MITARVITILFLTAFTAVAETRVRITGMRQKSENQVLDLMGGRLVHVRASPASPPLADDAAFILRQILLKDGYADVSVDWKVTGRSEILLIVKEGGRLSLGTVTVNGVPQDDAELLPKIFAKPAEKNRPIAAGSPPFREGDVEIGLANVKQEMNARGYWTATVIESARSIDKATGSVSLTLDVTPGPLHRIANPEIQSADGRAEDLARPIVAAYVDRTARTANLNEMRAAVEEAVVSEGYPDAKVRMGSRLEAGRFVPVFDIDLGTRVKLRKIRIEGLERTNPSRIAQRVGPMEGDWYDEAAMNKRLREFLATGAFSSARVETSEAGEKMVDATLHFDEARAKQVSLGAGFGSYQGVITRATYADRNLAGNLWGLNSGFELGSRGLLGEVRITDPWLGGSDTAATARAYALIYGREGYDTYETGLDGKLTWKFGSHYTLDLLAGLSVVNLSSDGLPKSELGETLYSHPKLRLTQSVDYRDNPVLPTDGWHLENPLEIGAAVGGTSTSYIMAGLTAGWYHSINRQYAIGIGGEWGVLVPGGDGTDLPIDLRLFNGGARSVRSFPERELGPTVDGFPTGGESMWNTNFELIRSITGSVKAVAFVDAGALSREYEGVAVSDIEIATGLGIRLDLPIGPVRLEYGYNLTRDEDEPTGAVHFAIGIAY